jgi:hypothetical protein
MKVKVRSSSRRRMRVSATQRRRGLEPKTSQHPLSSQVEREIPTSKFAFPKERKEPLSDPGHVRNAIARFNQVEGVSQAERNAARRRIKSAAKRYGIEIRVEKPKAKTR